MSIITTNKNALKLLRIDGTNTLKSSQFTINGTNDLNQSTKPKRKNKIEIKLTSKSNGNFMYNDNESLNDVPNNNDISGYIRKISEMEPTPEYSSASDDDEDEDFYDEESDKHKKKSKGADVIGGIESMLRRLQEEAKQIEQSRYEEYANGIQQKVKITKSSPNEIIKLTQNIKTKFGKSKNMEAMNWWDQPFRDHLRSAKRPIMRETGIDQFASEYMLTMLREQEQSVLKKRQIVEFKRTRRPIDNWYEMKSSSFGNELRRHNRQM